MNEALVQAERALASLGTVMVKGWRIKTASARQRRLVMALDAAKLVNQVRLGALAYGAVPRHPESYRHLTEFWLRSLESLAHEALDTSLDLVTVVKAGDWPQAREFAGNAGGQVSVAGTLYGLLYHGEEIFAKQEAARLNLKAHQ